MRVSVTVDDREPSALVAAFRHHSEVENVTVERLSAGDVTVDDVGFERKTVRDYVGSAMGRTGPDIDDQVRRMNANYDHTYVLLEGDLASVERLDTAVPPAAVRGSMASVTARLGAPVIPCSDEKRLVDMAVRIARKHLEDPGTRQLPTSAVGGRNEPIAKRMYGCIDGVGPTTADALYEAYPTVEELLVATPSDLTAVAGVGEKRATAIYRAFRDEG